MIKFNDVQRNMLISTEASKRLDIKKRLYILSRIKAGNMDYFF
jgi:hypothetical protein